MRHRYVSNEVNKMTLFEHDIELKILSVPMNNLGNIYLTNLN